MNFADSPCLGWLVPQRSAVTQLLGLVWRHPLACVPRRGGSQWPGLGPEWACCWVLCHTRLSLHSVLSLTCHWTCSLSQGPPRPFRSLLRRAHAWPCWGSAHTAALPGRASGLRRAKACVLVPGLRFPCATGGALAGLVSSAGPRAP